VVRRLRSFKGVVKGRNVWDLGWKLCIFDLFQKDRNDNGIRGKI